MAFVSGGDSCLSIYQHVYAQGVLTFPQDAQVLEIGSAEADWMTPMLADRPDLHITGIDWRRHRRPGTVVQADVLTHDFPAASFDVVVGISSIEHIGLGHYEHDPIDGDGDTHCMQRVVQWLKPGGWVYLDVPYDETRYAVIGTSHRSYNAAAVRRRLLVPGLTVQRAWYADVEGHLTARPSGTDTLIGYIAVLATKES